MTNCAALPGGPFSHLPVPLSNECATFLQCEIDHVRLEAGERERRRAAHFFRTNASFYASPDVSAHIPPNRGATAKIASRRMRNSTGDRSSRCAAAFTIL